MNDRDQLSTFTKELQKELLDVLYEDEKFNVFLIHYIENQIEDLGELYISQSHNQITGILHLKFDGNSYFTNFYYINEEGLNEIIKTLTELHYPKVLLTGLFSDVKSIIQTITQKEMTSFDYFYQYEDDTIKLSLPSAYHFRLANKCEEDIRIISDFLIKFFEPINENEIIQLTNHKKILEDLKVGIYFIEHHKEVVGMARFSGYSQHYIDITTVYIKPDFRNQGLGKMLMSYMVSKAIEMNKKPVTQTSPSNMSATKAYESIGFVKQAEYAYEFLT